MKLVNVHGFFGKGFVLGVLVLNQLLSCLYSQEGGQQLLSGLSAEAPIFNSHRSEMYDFGYGEPDKEEYGTEQNGAETRGAIEDIQSTERNTATISKHSYFFRYTHSMRQGARFAAGAAGTGYIGYLHLESPVPMPYFEISVKNFGVGLYPLASLQTAKHGKKIPTLFLGAGCLTFGSLLKTASDLGFSAITPSYAGLRFPRENFISVGSAQKDVHYGVELYGNGWNGVFFVSPEKKMGRMRYGLLGSWRIKHKNPDIQLCIQYLTAFLPDAEQSSEPNAALSSKNESRVKRRYHKLFALNAIFIYPIISFEAAGFCSYAADKTVSGGARTEYNLFYRYVGLNGAVSYTAAQYRGWDIQVQKNQLSTFIQPYLKINIFSLSALYTFSTVEHTKLHRGGVSIHVKHKNADWQASWHYTNGIHTVKTGIALISSPAWFSGLQWFKQASVDTVVHLQNKAQNPLIVKKYTITTASSFFITERIGCGLSGSLSQTVHTERSTVMEGTELVYLQNPVYRVGAFLGFKRSTATAIHSGKLELSGKNAKPYFDLKIAYQIQGW